MIKFIPSVLEPLVLLLGASQAEGAQTATFKIDSLSPTAVAAGDTGPISGDVKGGIGFSSDNVFVRGDSWLGAFPFLGTGGPFDPGTEVPGSDTYAGWSDMFATDLRTQKTWAFNWDGSDPATVTKLTALDSVTGALTGEEITLSAEISLDLEESENYFYPGIFAGYGRILLIDGELGKVYDIELPSGTVTEPATLDPDTSPYFLNRETSETTFRWGVVEYFDGALHLTYPVEGDGTAGNPGVIQRMTVGSNALTTVFSVPQGTGGSGSYPYTFGDDPSFVVDCARDQWYLSYEYGSDNDWVSGQLPDTDDYDEPVVSFGASFTYSGTCGPVSVYSLDVEKAGSGSGTVTSSPEGIDCGSTCSGEFEGDSTVTLTATPSSGSNFSGWSGSGCSGTGSCEVTMSEARSVTATFDLASSGKPKLNLSINTPKKAKAGKAFGLTVKTSNVAGTAATRSASARSATTAKQVKTCAKLPKGLFVVERDGGKVKGQTICWTRSSLAAGKSVTYKPTIRSSKTRSGSAKVTGTASATNDSGASVNASGSGRIRIIAQKAPKPKPPTG